MWCRVVFDGVAVTNSANVSISKRSVTLTSGSASKAYDGTALTKKTVSVSGSGWVSGQGATYTYTGTQTNVGSSANTFAYALTSGTLAGNYAITTKTGTLTVTKRAMSAVSVSDLGVIDYTGAAITPSVMVSDGSPSIVKASDYTVSYADNIQPGTARIILTATAGGNYTGTKTVPFTIRKATFDIDDGTDGEGGKNSSFSYAGVYDGQGHGINVQIADPSAGTTVKYACGQPDKAPGGTWSTVKPLYTNVCDNVVWYAVECAGYVSYTNNATVTITPRAVTVTADAKEKAFGTPDPALTYVANGLLGTDALTGALTREPGETVGTYDILQGTLANANYAISYVGANYVIRERIYENGGVVIDPSDSGWEVVLTNDVDRLRFPDNLGTVAIKLNGHGVYGADEDTYGALPPAVEIYPVAEDGPPTILKVLGDGCVCGGSIIRLVRRPDAWGTAGDGICVDGNVRDGVAVSIESGVVVQGGGGMVANHGGYGIRGRVLENSGTVIGGDGAEAGAGVMGTVLRNSGTIRGGGNSLASLSSDPGAPGVMGTVGCNTGLIAGGDGDDAALVTGISGNLWAGTSASVAGVVTGEWGNDVVSLPENLTDDEIFDLAAQNTNSVLCAYDKGGHSLKVRTFEAFESSVQYALSRSGPYASDSPQFSDVTNAVIWYVHQSALFEPAVTNVALLSIVKGVISADDEEPGEGAVPSGGLSKFDTTFVYDGAGHTINTHALSAAFKAALGADSFVVSYARGGVDAPAGSWEPISPSYTDVGEYVVWYKVTSPNYEDFAHAAKVTVSKRAMSAVSVSDPGVIDYTGAAITPPVTVSDGSPSIVKASDYTVSYADNVQPGTARIILTATAGGNYTGTKTVPFTIRKATFDIDDGMDGEGGKNSSFSYAGVYDGQGHGINVQIADPPAGTTVKYACGGTAGPWSTVNPLFTNVCDSVVWYAVECAGYISYTNNATVTIRPRAVTVKSASKTKTYDGTALKLTAGDITVGRAGSMNPPTGGESGGFIETALPAGESFVFSNLASITEAGETSATFSYVAGPGTDLANYAITTEYGTLTVTKATLDAGSVFPGLETWTEEDGFACTRVYNGKPQPFEVAVAEDFTEAYEFLYALTPGAWSPVAPTRTTVAEGPVKVYFKFISPNFEPYEGYGTLQVVEKEITDEMVQPGEDAFFFDGDAKKPTVDVIHEVDGQDICKESDYDLVYGEKAAAGWWVTVTGKGNYSGTVTKIVPVLKRPVAPPVVPSRSYNGKTQKPTIPTDSRWTVVANPGGIDVGEYTNVVLRLTDTANYKWKGGTEEATDITLVFRVTKANNNWSQYPDMKGWAYGETPSEPAMGRARYGTVQVAYRKADADVSTETATRPELPGQYIARFYVEALANYIGVSRDVAFEITGTAPGGDHTTTTPVPVPYVWLDTYLTQFGGGSDYETAGHATGANGVALWESYVAGLDPTDPTSQFTANITMGANGEPIVTWSPDLSKDAQPRTYTILGKPNLGAKTEWVPVTDANKAQMKFFKVSVEIK